jgi:hypothetical protein
MLQVCNTLTHVKIQVLHQRHDLFAYTRLISLLKLFAGNPAKTLTQLVAPSLGTAF